MDAVTITDVCKSFGEVRAVNSLNVTVPAGSIYGFLGPNGAGKTTTLRMIVNIIRDANGLLARVLSFFPLTTPMVMILRLSSGTDIWIVETLFSIVLLGASVLGGVWVAARVFRTGILMYGKRPGLREVGRWLRQA